MNIKFMSDLHLEFDGASNYMPTPTVYDKDTVLVLAGDICSMRLVLANFISDVSKLYKAVVMVFGNHEYYGKKFPREFEKKVETARGYSKIDNVYFLEKDSVIIDGVNFIGATMWTDYNGGNPLTMLNIETAMNDYNCIRSSADYRPLMPKTLYHDHQAARSYIFNALRPDMKNVVVTHHAPSYQSIVEKYRGDPVNAAYCSELFNQVNDLPEDLQPELWIHGHIHESVDYMLSDKTRVVSNPRGYQDFSYAPPTNTEFKEYGFVEL